MTNGLLAPKQQRSRHTLARLLKATLETLETYGLEGATIPRIAAAAGVAPATVYRRFQNRDSLYRAAMLAALEASAEASRKSITLESFEEKSLEGVIARLISIIMQQYRSHPGIMRALTRFIESDSDDNFREKALGLTQTNFERITDVLMLFRQKIAHRDPRRAITFGLLTAATIIEVRALEEVSMWHQLLPMTDTELHTELTRAFLVYLESPAGSSTRKKKRHQSARGNIK